MKPTRIYYEKCFNIGNFENEKIGMEIELEAGEKATDAINKARETVSRIQNEGKTREALNEIVNNPDRYTHTKFESAKKQLEELEDNDLPF